VAKLVGDDQRRNTQWKGQGKTTIETTFTFDPAKASLAFACAGFTRTGTVGHFADSVFLSRVIPIPGSRQAELSVAWNEHLKVTHAASPLCPGGCRMLPADPAAHQARIDNMPTAYNSPHPAIVHLDWTYSTRP
jgi:hypothetical protein